MSGEAGGGHRYPDSAEKEITKDAMNEVLRETSKKHGYCLCIHPMMQLINFSGLTCEWCGQPMTDAAYSPESKAIRTAALLDAAYSPESKAIRTAALLDAHPEWKKADDSPDD